MNTLNILILICLHYCSKINCKSLKSSESRLFQRNKCEVIEIETGTLKPCEGSFIYEDKTYYGCTMVGKDRKVFFLSYEKQNGIYFLLGGKAFLIEQGNFS